MKPLYASLYAALLCLSFAAPALAKDAIRVTDTIGVFACPDGFSLRQVASVNELKPFDFDRDGNVCVDETMVNRTVRIRPQGGLGNGAAIGLGSLLLLGALAGAGGGGSTSGTN
ncbi:hypothetical protein [Pseudogemmobacter sp. W21_MBD1_M6]|uniref:hypothetical protein n=1 Tax=Pseudogemmobacter sp. W21_MBD1_M6 TaxID=3240271 RepID=UPI003F95F902